MKTCGKCGERQWSLMDVSYLGIFGRCWSCDRKAWSTGKLSLEEFEKREKVALKEVNKNDI